MEGLRKIWEGRKQPYKESYVNMLCRLFSFPITYLLYHMGCTPNMATIVGFLLRMAAAVFIALNGFGFRPPGTDSVIYLVFGGTLCWIGLVFDGVDGELARLKNAHSDFGYWLDGVLDRVSDPFILIAVSLNALNHTGHFQLTLLGALFATASTTLWRYLALLTQVVFKFPLNLLPITAEKPIGFEAGMMYLMISVGALLNQLWYVMWFFAIVVNGAWIKNILVNIYKMRFKK